MSEHDTQAAFVDWCNWNLGKYPALRWIHAIPNGGDRHRVVAAKMKAEGVKPGVLDMFLPVAQNGYHGLYIEFKHGRNKMSEAQKDFSSFVLSHGYQVALCYTVDEAIHAVETYLSIRSR